MSAIGITGPTQTLAQYLQSVNGNPLEGTIGNATGAAAAQTGGIADSTAATQGISGGQHHRGGGSGFFNQVQSAVTSALRSAQASGSATDPNTVIEDAIQQVLQQTGGGDGEASSDALGGSSETTSADPENAFAQLLQSNGVDPAQFHQDFLTAITASKNGGTNNPSAIFSGFPTGSAIDEIV